MCHMSCVTCHVSRVTCHMSHVFFFFTFSLLNYRKEKEEEKYDFFYTTKNIGQSGGASWWRVCYQTGPTPSSYLHIQGILLSDNSVVLDN